MNVNLKQDIMYTKEKWIFLEISVKPNHRFSVDG